jgi:chromosome partitioning protein
VPAVKEFHALTKTGIPKKKLLFILNRTATTSEASASKAYLKEAGYNCCPVVLSEKASYRQVQNEGKSISEVSYKGLQKQAKELVRSLLGYL